MDDDTTLRGACAWGDAAAPILELEPLPLQQVLIR